VKDVCRDPEDDAVLSAAVEGRAEVIVTGDDDLLSLVRGHHDPVAARVLENDQRLNSKLPSFFVYRILRAQTAPAPAPSPSALGSASPLPPRRA